MRKEWLSNQIEDMADPGFAPLSTPPLTVLYRLLSVFCAGLGLSITSVVTEPALVVMIMTAKCPSEIIIRTLWGEKKKFITSRPGNCIAYRGHIIRLGWGWCRESECGLESGVLLSLRLTLRA